MAFQKKFYLLLALILWCFATISGAQSIIKGTVKDAKTGKPMPAVNVYLSNTTIGNFTKKEGKYKIETTETGLFKLVFSFTGYKRKVMKIHLYPHSTSTFDASLEPKIYQMKDLTVTGSNKKWKRRFKRFKKYFIGTSKFANQTTIQNSYILHFSEDHHTLTAKAKKPLIVINRALGYKIYVRLAQFKFRGFMKGYYLIYPRYVTLEPKNEKQLQEWKHNRRKTYKKSLKHFLVSLYHHRKNHEHYRIKHDRYLYPLADSIKQEALRGKAPARLAKMLKGFKLAQKDWIIHYRLPANKYNGARLNPSKNINTLYAEASLLIPNTHNHIFFIDKNGVLLNPRSIIISGYWAKLRLADHLPLNYTQ
jgi:hypothetical protein